MWEIYKHVIKWKLYHEKKRDLYSGNHNSHGYHNNNEKMYNVLYYIGSLTTLREYILDVQILSIEVNAPLKIVCLTLLQLS